MRMEEILFEDPAGTAVCDTTGLTTTYKPQASKIIRKAGLLTRSCFKAFPATAGRQWHNLKTF